MASVSFYSPYVGTRDGQGCADSGGLSASAGLAATLASAGLSLPWLGSTPGYAYPLIAPPGRGASATGPPSGAPPGAAGRWAAAPGFDGLFRPREASAKPQEEIFGSAAGDAVRQQQQQQQQQQPQLQQRQQLLQQQEQQRQRSWLGKALEESPAGLATATASASSSPGVAVAMPEGILHVRVLAAHRLVNRDTGLFGDVSDPYVAVRASGKECRTPILQNNLDPIWLSDNEFTFSTSAASCLLELQVMNSNMLRDDSLGTTTVSVWDLPRGSWHRRRVVLEGGAGAELSFQVRLECSSEAEAAPKASAAAAEAARQRTGLCVTSRSQSLRQPPKPCIGSALQRRADVRLPADWEEALGEDGESSEEEDWAAPRSSPQGPGAFGIRRGLTYSVPDDFFGETRLEVGDPTIGPASAWQRAACYSAPAQASPWSDDAAHLASLEEALRRGNQSEGVVRGGREPQAPLSSVEDAALAKALGKEKAAKNAAQDELQKILKRLQELESEAAQAAQAAQEARAALAASKPQSKAAAFPPAAPSAPLLQAASSLGPAFGASATTPSLFQAPGSAVAASPQPWSTGAPSASAPMPKAAAPAAPAAPPLATSNASGGSGYRERYTLAVAQLQRVELELEPFKKDPSHKDFRLQAKKAMNTKVGQISATWSRIQECTSGLCSLLEQYAQDQNPLRMRFAEHAMASRLVDDAEVGIRSQPRAAWPVAEVTCRIFERFPAIQELFTGLMCLACPYLKPDFSGSQVGRQGLASCQRGGEAFTDFAGRMVSYHRLWLAVVVTQGDLGTVWHWFARTLNEPPCPMTAPMVHAALDAVGADAQARYGTQFVKLVAYIEREYMADVDQLQKRTKGEEADRLRASQSRLRRWLDDFRNTGRAPAPEGRYVEAREEAELNPNI
ncbi:unnamed protein product [Polarella glacialis]|uniref:mRNA export factor GLE1 n=1 Tax=Polarella glacialis TaxID=89957 RepID=A0A813IID0_POLGL|nr:unnamed protein product [Polarella glacialis]